MAINLSFEKYKSIEEITEIREFKNLLDKNLYIFEKIDGGLCQIRIKEGRLLPGSKANYLIGEIVNRNEWFKKFVSWVYSNFTLYNLPNDVIVFGEWSGNHTIDYGENNDKFFLIDIFNLNERRFMNYEKSQEFLTGYEIKGINFLPILASGKVEKETLDDLLKRNSNYYPGPKEGLVIKSYEGNQKFVKILNEGFAEQRARLFGGTDPFTEARVRKNILYAFEEYDRKELNLEKLYELIRQDVKKETGRNYDLNYVKKKIEPLLEKMLKRKRKNFPINLNLKV